MDLDDLRLTYICHSTPQGGKLSSFYMIPAPCLGDAAHGNEGAIRLASGLCRKITLKSNLGKSIKVNLLSLIDFINKFQVEGKPKISKFKAFLGLVEDQKIIDAFQDAEFCINKKVYQLSGSVDLSELEKMRCMALKNILDHTYERLFLS